MECGRKFLAVFEWKQSEIYFEERPKVGESHCEYFVHFPWEGIRIDG